MVEAMLADRLKPLGGIRVRSAGMLSDGLPADAAAVRAMSRFSLDIASHRSRKVTVDDLESADLVVALDRDCLRTAVVLAPDAWPRAFTLKELARRGRACGLRPETQPLPAWVGRAHRGRTRSDLLGSRTDDDVTDPAGGPQRGYDRTAAVLSSLVAAMIGYFWPDAPALTIMESGLRDRTRRKPVDRPA
jgi:protein-tyrosine-phosphatase